MRSGHRSGAQGDPLAPAQRAARTASWGPVTPEAEHLGDRLAARFERIAGPVAPPRRRSHTDAQCTPPSIPAGRLEGRDLDALARITPVLQDDATRRAYSLGKSWPDLVAARGSALEAACDAVLRPRTEDELERALATCAESGIAVVPVGGGTSVVGGIEPLGRSRDEPVVALDVTSLATCLDVDARSGVATFQAGVRGPDLERALAPYGLTLGHVPQSFEYSTLGGWIATRSAGQQSLRYGKIESMVAALRLVTPVGAIDVPHVPAHGAGSDLRELALGSEGTLGVVTRAAVRVRRRPDVVRFTSYLFADFEEACDAARELVRSGGARPTMVRVSDAAETAFNVGASVPRALGGGLGRALARVIGAGQGSLVLVLTTGTGEEVRRTGRAVDRQMTRLGGRGLGAMPTRAWYHGRFTQPYARDVLMDRGLLVDTLETSATWSRVPELHAQVRSAIEGVFGADRCVVGAHLSHMYHDGASAYFTFLAAPPDGQDIELWRAAKRAAHAAIARCGGAASHQHGVGTMHADLFDDVTPHLGREALRAIRARLDPTGTCNPGKVLDRPADGLVVVNSVARGGGRSAGIGPRVVDRP